MESGVRLSYPIQNHKVETNNSENIRSAPSCDIFEENLEFLTYKRKIQENDFMDEITTQIQKPVKKIRTVAAHKHSNVYPVRYTSLRDQTTEQYVQYPVFSDSGNASYYCD